MTEKLAEKEIKHIKLNYVKCRLIKLISGSLILKFFARCFDAYLTIGSTSLPVDLKNLFRLTFKALCGMEYMLWYAEMQQL